MCASGRVASPLEAVFPNAWRRSFCCASSSRAAGSSLAAGPVLVARPLWLDRGIGISPLTSPMTRRTLFWPDVRALKGLSRLGRGE